MGTEQGRVNRWAIALVIALGAVVLAKAPEPDAAAQKAASEAVKKAHPREHRQPRARETLSPADELLVLAEKEPDPAKRHALMRHAQAAALQAGDVSTAVRALEMLAGQFDVDLVKLKTALLEQSRNATQQNTVPHWMRLAEQAIEIERFDVAVSAASSGEAVARASRDAALIEDARVELARIRNVAQEGLKMATAMKTLKATPNDPAANFAVGRYYAMIREQWELGLPYLVKGHDAAVAKAAKLEVAKPADVKEQAAAGAAWWDASLRAERAALQKRAAHWYALCVDALEGAEKKTAQTRLAQGKPKTGPVQGKRSTDPEVLAALKSTIEFIYMDAGASGTWERGGGAGMQEGHATAVTVYALACAGEKTTNPKLAMAVERLIAMQMRSTPTASARMLALCALDPQRHAQVIQADAAAILNTINAQGLPQRWLPGREGGAPDESMGEVAQVWFALHEASAAGVKLPPKAWSAIATTVVKGQQLDGSWGRDPNGRTQTVGSTASAMTVLTLAKKYIPEKESELAERALVRGSAWMNSTFTGAVDAASIYAAGAGTTPAATGGTGRPVTPGAPTAPRLAMDEMVLLQRWALLAGRGELNKMDWYATVNRNLVAAMNAGKQLPRPVEFGGRREVFPAMTYVFANQPVQGAYAAMFVGRGGVK